MKINISKATFSSIVGIGQKVKKASKESGERYLVDTLLLIYNLWEINYQMDTGQKKDV
jgi:hypothetical protein